MSKTTRPTPAPTANAIGPCPTIIQIVGRPGTGNLPRTIAPPDHSRMNTVVNLMMQPPTLFADNSQDSIKTCSLFYLTFQLRISIFTKISK